MNERITNEELDALFAGGDPAKQEPSAGVARVEQTPPIQAVTVKPSKSMQLAKRSTVADDCIITPREAAQDQEGFWRFCALLAPGEASAVTGNITRQAIVAAKVMAGAELGFPPMTSVRLFHYVKGQVALSAHAMKANAIQHSVRFAYSEGSGDGAWWCECTGNRTYANGAVDTYSFRYDTAMARKAGLWRAGSPWDTTPWAMVRKTATVEVCRVLVPDVLGGLYDPDELGGADPLTPAAPAVGDASAILTLDETGA